MNIIWRFDVFIFFTVRDRFDSVLDMYMSVIQCCWLLSEEWVASVSSQSLQIAAYNGSHSTIDHSIPIQNKSTIIANVHRRIQKCNNNYSYFFILKQN